MILFPFAPCRRDYGAKRQLKAAVDERPNDGYSFERRPEASRLLVEHQLVGPVQQPACAKRKATAATAALIRNHGAAECAVDDGQVHAADAVDGHLVPCEDAFGV